MIKRTSPSKTIIYCNLHNTQNINFAHMDMTLHMLHAHVMIAHTIGCAHR